HPVSCAPSVPRSPAPARRWLCLPEPAAGRQPLSHASLKLAKRLFDTSCVSRRKELTAAERVGLSFWLKEPPTTSRLLQHCVVIPSPPHFARLALQLGGSPQIPTAQWGKVAGHDVNTSFPASEHVTVPL